MTDLYVQPDAYGQYDGVMFGGDLVADDSLRSAVLASLLTERENPDAADGDRRGWWADALNADPADRWGSLLWTLARSKRTPQVLTQAKGFAEDALAWITADGIASKVTVTASWIDLDGLGLDIQIQKPDGIERIRLAYLWAASLGDPMASPNQIAADAARISSLYDVIYYTTLPEVSP